MSVRKLHRWTPLLLLSLVGGSAAMPVASTAVHGTYVEVRSASVFAGACHYNGERVTEGRSAVLAWSIAGGAFDGVDLAGVKVIAAVACDDNLAEQAAARKSEFTIDAASDAQSTAAAAWIRSRCGEQLGSVVGVRRGAISFRHNADTFAVSAEGVAAVSVRPMPDRACCSQPQLVWYRPLMPIDDRRVGYTDFARLDAPRVGPAWQRADENSAFYGSFDR